MLFPFFTGRKFWIGAGFFRIGSLNSPAVISPQINLFAGAPNLLDPISSEGFEIMNSANNYINFHDKNTLKVPG